MMLDKDVWTMIFTTCFVTCCRKNVVKFHPDVFRLFAFHILDLVHGCISVVYPNDLEQLLREVCLVTLFENVLVRRNANNVSDLKLWFWEPTDRDRTVPNFSKLLSRPRPRRRAPSYCYDDSCGYSCTRSRLRRPTTYFFRSR